jgi:outer membrane protein assembly factor BamB
LRLWPAELIVVLQWSLIYLAQIFAAGTMIQFFAMFMGPMVGAALFTGWWLFASRLPWKDRVLGLLAFVAMGLMAMYFAHPTIGGMPMAVFGLPVITLSCAVWLLVSSFLRWRARRIGLLFVLVLGWGYFTLVRLDGVDGSIHANMTYRWMPTPEDKFLAEAARKKSTLPVTEANVAESTTAQQINLEPGDWPGFRGPDRDARLAGVRLVADWEKTPPRQVWRHRVGPGWSSFAVVGNRLYTQEQLGADEAVICYDASTGEELWTHRDAVRFTETMAGPGPRATPTFHDGMIYALGAKGALNCLDAVTGSLVWTRDIADDAKAKTPIWGFASSPLVVAGVVTVFAGGPDDKAVLGYKAETGEPAWSAGKGAHSYCSTQLSRLDDVEQLVISTDEGMAGFDPVEGKVLWNYSWPLGADMSRVVQPAVAGPSELLIGTGFGNGTRRVQVTREGNSWTTRDVWSAPTRAIRPYYNDLVIHKGHIYGFDNNFFTCVNLEDGKAKWKARGYGNGQVLLVVDQDLLLILSETGEVALVDAQPDRHQERCKFQAIDGKTWNHPVFAHGRLYVRNGEEAACYELHEESDTGVEDHSSDHSL